MKVFISHKWQDELRKDWVKKLCSDLILKYKIECLLDLFEPVVSIAAYMQKIQECDVVLIIMTKNCTESINSNEGNIFFETSLAITQSTKNKLRIIPVLKEGLDVATILSVYRYIDFRNDSKYENKLQELSDAIFLKPFRPEISVQSEISPTPSEVIYSAPFEKRKSLFDEYISKMGHLIHKLKAKDITGRFAYYFVLVQPILEKSFTDKVNNKGDMDIENYGKVIASCYGETPTQEVKDYLKERYGFEV
jgi:TIR domain